MKTVPVVIWYNPHKIGNGRDAVDNIKTYSDCFETVMIIDNSDHDNKHMLSAIDNALYFPNYENVGIAKALNQGCQKALESGYEWALTMDQDSYWSSPDELRRYMKLSEKMFLSDKKNISFSPTMVKLHDLIPDGSRTNDSSQFEHVEIIWTSGNIVNLRVWHDVGEFNEQLFIDDVDHEFCYRLLSKGYHLINIQNCFMNHEVGAASHRGVRMYYIVRNGLYMKKHWPAFWKKYRGNWFLPHYFLGRIRRFRIKDLYFMTRGVVHARKGIYGKYKN